MTWRLCASFSVLCAFGAGFAAAQPGGGKHTISGTVVNSVTGEPLAGALVVATIYSRFEPGQQGPATPQTLRAVTEVSGRFSFEAETAGGGTLRVTRQGYHSADGQAAVEQVLVTADSRETTVRLAPESVVTGRALNPEGEPLSGMTVELIRVEIADGRRELRDNVARAVTDDRGEYRIWNLPAGSYYIKFAGRVAMRNYYTANAAFEFGDTSYGPVYFPSAERLDTAQLVKIAGGQTVDAPFTVEGHRAYQIRGRAVNVPPQRSLQIRLLRGNEIAASRGGFNMAAGTFQVADVVPGTYTVQLYTADGGPLWVGEAPVTVGERDVAGLSVAMMSGMEVRGHVQSFQDGANVVGLLRAQRVDSQGPPGVSPVVYAVQGVDGFTFRGLFPGRYEIETNGAAGGYLSSIRSGNTDVMTEGLNVPVGGTPDIVVEITRGGGTINVRLEGVPDFQEGQLPRAMFNVLLVGQNGGRSAFRTQDAFGNSVAFAFVAPGDYTLYAWPSSRQVEFRNPAALAGLSQYASPVRISEADTKEVTLKPVPAETLP